MAERRLTDLAVQKIKAPSPGPNGEVVQEDHWDKLDGGGSLGLRVSSNGVRTWVVIPRALRKGKKVKVRVTLGRYPAIGLAKAREMAAEAFVLARQGLDPEDVVKTAQKTLVTSSANTFGAAVDEFFDKYVTQQGLKQHTANQYRIALRGQDVTSWIDRPVSTIKRIEVIDALDAIVRRGSPIMANKTLAYWKTFFGWCVERDLIEFSPAERVSSPAKNKQRDRVLSTQEIRDVWAAFEAYGGPFEPVFKLLLLTGQRKEEVGGLEWAELRSVDKAGGLWEIPKERTKNKLPHLVPLAPSAVALIAAAKRVAGSRHVFVGRNPKGKLGGYSRAKEGVDSKVLESRSAAKLPNIPPWVLHDMRRTVSTRMHEDLGVQPHIVEAVLNHVSGHKAGVAGTYNRALYLDEKRKALNAWAEHLARLIVEK